MKDVDPPKDAPSVLDGSLSIEELSQMNSGRDLLVMGKATIKDAGAKLRQIMGLKPGSSSIRTPEMIDEIVDRLLFGESLTSINTDPRMPAVGTLWNWRDADPALDDRIRKAQQRGAHMLVDIKPDIAQGGIFSTGDARRDELYVKVIDKNVSLRNRAEFGERVQVDHARVTVNLPVWSIKVSKTVQALEDHSEADPED
ncbi:MAG: hypothetical protein AABZ76_07335 [Pseudomonadota bacterium]